MANKEKISLDEIDNFLENYTVKQFDTFDSDEDTEIITHTVIPKKIEPKKPEKTDEKKEIKKVPLKNPFETEEVSPKNESNSKKINQGTENSFKQNPFLEEPQEKIKIQTKEDKELTRNYEFPSKFNQVITNQFTSDVDNKAKNFFDSDEISNQKPESYFFQNTQVSNNSKSNNFFDNNDIVENYKENNFFDSNDRVDNNLIFENRDLNNNNNEIVLDADDGQEFKDKNPETVEEKIEEKIIVKNEKPGISLDSIYNDYSHKVNNPFSENLDDLIEMELNDEKESVEIPQNIKINELQPSKILCESNDFHFKNSEKIAKGKTLIGKFIKNYFFFNKNSVFSVTNFNSISKLDKFLDQNYFPLNYSDNSKDNVLKIKNILTKAKNEVTHLKNEELIIFSILHNFFFSENYIVTLFKTNGGEFRREILKDVMGLLQRPLNNAQNSNTKINQTDKNIFDSFKSFDYEISQLLNECQQGINFQNFLVLSLFGRKDELNAYIKQTFEQNSHLKETLIYIVFMIKSGNIAQLITEKSELILSNFYQIIAFLAKNISFFEAINIELFFQNLEKNIPKNITLDKFLIIKLLNKNFINYDHNLYSEIVAKFLICDSSFRIFLVEVLNYLFYLNLQDKEDEKLKRIAFISIFLKFKFVRIFDSPDKIDSANKQKDLKSLLDKIILKKDQFGGIGMNTHFSNYLKNMLNFNLGESDEKSEDSRKIEQEKNNKPNKEKEKGSSFFGLFSDKSKQTPVSENQEKKKSENIVYDPVLKRYVINGEIPKEEPSEVKKPNSEANISSVNKAVQSNTSKTAEIPKQQGIVYDPVLKRYLINGEVPVEDDPRKNVKPAPETLKKEVVLPPPIKKQDIKIQETKLTSQNEEKKSEPQKESTSTQNINVSDPFSAKLIPKKNNPQPPKKITPNISMRYTSQLLDNQK